MYYYGAFLFNNRGYLYPWQKRFFIGHSKSLNVVIVNSLLKKTTKLVVEQLFLGNFS